MHLRPEELLNQLKTQLLPVYVVSGDEPLLVQEACDLIRQHARQQGCTEREVIDASPKNFDWQEILASATSMSLFSNANWLKYAYPVASPGPPVARLCALMWILPAPMTFYCLSPEK
jgi:DNA polymerase-3 subunit delta